jgi:hypothetical protein
VADVEVLDVIEIEQWRRLREEGELSDGVRVGPEITAKGGGERLRLPSTMSIGERPGQRDGLR